MPFIAIAAVIVLALGGGVTYAADQSKPGDALYSYKVDVNDNIRHEYHAVRASIGVEASGNASATDQDASQQQTDASAPTTDNAEVRNGPMIPAGGAAINASSSVNDSGTLNADGSVKVNIY